MLCPFYMTLVMLSISEIGLQRNIDKVYEFCKKKKKKKKKKNWGFSCRFKFRFDIGG